MRTEKKPILVYGVLMAFIFALLSLPTTLCAGEIEPGDPPGPTMKTLDEIPPTWSQKLPASERFELVLDGEGVLDKETGLVWERAPSTAMYTWTDAIAYCITRTSGGRRGWHLPKVEQLNSLFDNGSLPSGHLFEGDVTGDIYWTSTTDAADPDNAWAVYFGGAPLGQKNYLDPKEFPIDYAWCVRGGQSHDAY
ncbi:MAG: DUF1566 domain-containing protein [Planctomycetes bacterium]|nr:DUF1566 domain-containing protein [Planctomycetota bacterium]